MEKILKLLPNPTFVLQNPAALYLLNLGVEAVDIQVQAGPNALSQLLRKMVMAAAAALAVLLSDVEERLEALKDDPTPIGLVGESAETFSQMFTGFYGTIEELVEMAEVL